MTYDNDGRTYNFVAISMMVMLAGTRAPCASSLDEEMVNNMSILEYSEHSLSSMENRITRVDGHITPYVIFDAFGATVRSCAP